MPKKHDESVAKVKPDYSKLQVHPFLRVIPHHGGPCGKQFGHNRRHRLEAIAYAGNLHRDAMHLLMSAGYAHTMALVHRALTYTGGNKDKLKVDKKKNKSWVAAFNLSTSRIARAGDALGRPFQLDPSRMKKGARIKAKASAEAAA